jgi:putative Holliday junction resolvase
MRVISLDVGDRRIGVAVSDRTGFIARPLTILSRKGQEADIAAIKRLITEQEAAKIIVGLPLSLDGRVGPQAEKVRRFSEALGTSLFIPLELYDERFSTAAVKEHREEPGIKRKKKRAPDDAEAAAVILQSYLDENGGL